MELKGELRIQIFNPSVAHIFVNLDKTDKKFQFRVCRIFFYLLLLNSSYIYLFRLTQILTKCDLIKILLWH